MPPLLSHRSALSYRDALELLVDRGLEVSRESIRTWCINFSSEFAQNLRHQEPRLPVASGRDACGRGWGDSLVVGAVDEHGAVLNVLRQRHRNTSAAMSFFRRLLGE